MSSIRNDSVRLIWLSAFVAVAETGTYAAAAKQLNTSPETVSRYIDQLELWLWRRLRENVNAVELTTFGHDFLPVAKEIAGALWFWRAQRPQNADKQKRPPEIPIYSREQYLRRQGKLANLAGPMLERLLDRE